MDAESCDASTPITHRPSTSQNKSVENGHEDSARVQRFWRVGAYYGREQYKNTKSSSTDTYCGITANFKAGHESEESIHYIRKCCLVLARRLSTQIPVSLLPSPWPV